MPLDDSIVYRAKNLLLRYQEATGERELDSDGRGLIQWLNTKVVEENLSVVTAKCYRRWIAAYLEEIEHPAAKVVRSWLPPGSKEAAILEDEVNASETHLHLEANDSNTRYASYIAQDSLKLLMRQLVELTSSGTPRYKGGENVVAFLVNTAMTGLRPMEWPTARLLDSYFDPNHKLTLGPVLEVHTLKQTGRRDDNPLKEKRYLLLDQWPEEQLLKLRYFLDEVVAGVDFLKWYNTSRQTLSRAWARITSVDSSAAEEDRPAISVTFYTARHIFAEEVRRSLAYSRFELAAMLGHSMLTNQKYYGPRKGTIARGFDFALPRPWPGDAEEIMVWHRKLNPLGRGLQADMFGIDGQRESKDAIADFLAR